MRALRAGILAMSAAAAAAVFLVPAAPALAGTNDVWRLGIWSGTAGWIVMNCVSDGTCATNNYGVTIDATAKISGWAWSGNIGWVCFGASCGGTTPEGGAAYARVDAVTNAVHGWAKIESLGASGWILMNPADMGGAGAWAVHADRSTGNVTGWGWNGNADGSGLGWIDFSPSRLVQQEVCTDGIDNDGDGLIDCADPDCLGKPGPATCGAPYLCGLENDLTTCQDGCDNDGDGLADCADPTSCKAQPALGCPASEDLCSLGNADLCCSDFTDNDHNGLIDCADPACAGHGSCPSDEAHWPTCQPPDADGGGVNGVGGCCANLVDDDAALKPDGLYDCADASCSAICTGICSSDHSKCLFDWQCPPDAFGVQKCSPVAQPWLQSYLNDIYSKGQISGTSAAPSGRYNATFCLLSPIASTGVVNFTTDPSFSCGATQSGASGVGVPTGATDYATVLGKIDIAGIEKGAYGTVSHYASSQTDAVPSGVLGKHVWFVDGDLTIANPVSFANGTSGNGGGLVVVRGGDLHINADVTYAAGASVTNLRNLASVGFLVLKKNGVGGNILVAPGVQTLSGAYFAEGTFDTGASANPLTVYGPIVADAFAFSRTYADFTRGSEYVIYDSRTVLNPPPGLADLEKSLPTFGLGGS